MKAGNLRAEEQGKAVVLEMFIKRSNPVRNLLNFSLKLTSNVKRSHVSEIAMESVTMSHHFSYRILPDQRLTISRYAGEISENEVIAAKEAIKQDNNFNIRYHTLDDFSDATFHITKESYMRVFNWLRDHYSWKRHSAILTSTPEQVVNITLFNYLQNGELPMKIKIFSTLEAALLWMNLPPSETLFIRRVLKELKTGQLIL